MTDQELIEWEERIRHASHAVDRKKKALDRLLEQFADAVAADRGIAQAARFSGGTGTGKDDQEPGGGG